eukprot:COSAG05_NODE_525_length_8961_cov_212.374591_13_plen_186_part_00
MSGAAGAGKKVRACRLCIAALETQAASRQQREAQRLASLQRAQEEEAARQQAERARHEAAAGERADEEARRVRVAAQGRVAREQARSLASLAVGCRSAALRTRVSGLYSAQTPAEPATGGGAASRRRQRRQQQQQQEQEQPMEPATQPPSSAGAGDGGLSATWVLEQTHSLAEFMLAVCTPTFRP